LVPLKANVHRKLYIYVNKLKVLNKYILYPEEPKIFSERGVSFVRSTWVTDKAQEMWLKKKKWSSNDVGGRRNETNFQLTLISLEDWLHEPLNKLLLFPRQWKPSLEVRAVHEQKFPQTWREGEDTRWFRDNQALTLYGFKETNMKTGLLLEHTSPRQLYRKRLNVLLPVFIMVSLVKVKIFRCLIKLRKCSEDELFPKDLLKEH
jgi:hypothetical protein